MIMPIVYDFKCIGYFLANYGYIACDNVTGEEENISFYAGSDI